MIRHRFSFLLVTLLVLLLTVPLVQSFGTAAKVVFTTLFYGTLASAVLAVAERRKHFIVAGVLAAIVVVLRAVSLGIDEGDAWWLNIKVVGLVAEMLCFGYTIVLIVRFVLRADRVTYDMICASLCAYLLIGIVWAQLYILLTAAAMDENLALEYTVFSPSILDDPSGEIVAGAAEESGNIGRVDQMYVNAIYVSFVTLSTLGYGDITPKAGLARMFTVVEAIIGQFYLAVLVARLVGLYIAGAKEDGVPP